MQYLGSKRRHAKTIIPFILNRHPDATAWCEPFVGSGSMIERVPAHLKRIGGDLCPYVTALLRAVRDGWEPPLDVTAELHRAIRLDKGAYPPELVGFVGYGCCFGGSFFHGFAHATAKDNYVQCARNSLLRSAPALAGVDIHTCGYDELPIPRGAIIYCDPPYRGGSGYHNSRVFDHDSFHLWCSVMAAKGHPVYVSEYNAPEWMECVLEIPHTCMMNRKDKGDSPRVERLYFVEHTR